MNVSELIEELEKIEDKSKEVRYQIDLGWIKIGMNEQRVEDVIEHSNRVVLNSIFSHEKYERNK
jgi:hypothetical protein